MPKTVSVPDEVDALVIGSGLGGLICALEMQKNGLSTCLVEKRPIAGGYAHHFTRKDFRFDVSLHHIGGLGKGGMTEKLLGPLGVLEKLEYRKQDQFIISEFPDMKYIIPNNPTESLDYLSGFFPDEAENLRKLYTYSRRLKDHVIGPVLYPDFEVPMEEMLSLENVEDSFTDFCRRFVSDERLLAILGQLWMYLGLPPGSSAANFSNCVFASGFLESSYHISGGTEALVNAILERYSEEGGVLLLGNGVQTIEVQDKKAVGVKLIKGEFIKTGFIAANASPLDIFEDLVKTDETSPIFRHRLKNMKPSCSAYTMYIGLDCPASSLGIPRGNTIVNHGNNLDEAYQLSMEGRLDDSDWCLTNSEDPVLASEGKASIAIMEICSQEDWFDLTEEEYSPRKTIAQNRLMEKYNRRFPGLKDHAAIVEFGTPRTMQRYSSNAFGALYGFAQTPAQSNNKRIPNRTPVEGLFLSGAWTQAGGGFEGTMMTGMKTAHMILQATGREWDTGLRHGAEQIGVPNLSTPAYPFYSNTYTIYPDDSDYTGTTKETTFLRFMDRARVRLLEQSAELQNISDVLKSYYVKLYSISAHIHDSASVGEEVTIQTGYKKATSHRAAVDQCICGADGRIILTGKAEIMFVTTGEELIELPAIYQEHEEVPFETVKAALPPQLFADLSNHSHRAEFLVSYEDTDMQGVVYNVSYIKIAQKMLWTIRNEVLPAGAEFSRLRCEHIDIRFMTPARLHETIVVQAGIRSIDGHRFGVDYRMTLKETKAVLTDIHLEYRVV